MKTLQLETSIVGIKNSRSGTATDAASEIGAEIKQERGGWTLKACRALQPMSWRVLCRTGRVYRNARRPPPSATAMYRSLGGAGGASAMAGRAGAGSGRGVAELDQRSGRGARGWGFEAHCGGGGDIGARGVGMGEAEKRGVAGWRRAAGVTTPTPRAPMASTWPSTPDLRRLPLSLSSL
jgi:hypothetical protein